MNYPLISEYIEAIKSSRDNFHELAHLRPVLGTDGQPLMTSGNFAVIFKIEDKRNEKHNAVKCFIKEQKERKEAFESMLLNYMDIIEVFPFC
jgi:predicted nucleotide-binding protein (sugar kinase/HSP70/actin superfamily)